MEWFWKHWYIFYKEGSKPKEPFCIQALCCPRKKQNGIPFGRRPLCSCFLLFAKMKYKPGSRASIKEGPFSSSQCFQLWIKLMMEEIVQNWSKIVWFWNCDSHPNVRVGNTVLSTLSKQLSKMNAAVWGWWWCWYNNGSHTFF